MLGGWSATARQVALFEMSGQGRIAEVGGDLQGAKHLVVYVPGMGTDLWEFDRLVKPRTEVVRSRAETLDAEVAAISWLGYDTPRQLDVVGAVHEELASAGGAALSQFLREMVGFAPPGVHVTVVAHSYGSVVAGLAARDHGLAAHELVVLGSPGLGVETANQLSLMPGGRVWAAHAHADPVVWLTRLEDHPVHIHGPSPTEPRFGAHVFPVSATGHTGYFEDEQCVSTLAAIAVGRGPDEIAAIGASQ
jgi:pimeloyl-ACP methyl ester carboxylesterase